MKHFLRYSFVALMAMFMGNAWAEEVVDFTAQGYENAAEVAEFKGTNVTITFAGNGASNNPKWYNSGTAIRMYAKNSMTITSTKTIKQIVFTLSSDGLINENNKGFSVGEYDFDKMTWTGSATEITLTNVAASGNQIRLQKLEIYFDGDNIPGGDEPTTPAQEMSVADVIAYTVALGADVESTEDVTVKGKICSIKFTYSADYGTATYNISDDGQTGEGKEFTVYGSYYFDNKKWEEGKMQIAVGDEVVVKGKVIYYKGTTPEFANKKNYLVSLNGKTKDESTTPTTPDTPTEVNVAKALEIINALEDGKTTSDEYLVKGFVVGAPEFQRKADGTLYGNANFAIADEKGGTTTVTVFRAKNLNNENFTEETISSLKENDEVVVRGKLQKYVDKNGVMTPEVSSCYLVSVTSSQSEEAGQVWDFTKWSDATIANLKAEAAKVTVEDDPDNAGKTKCTDNGALWSDHEKASKCDTYNASKDNCFWSVAEPNADGELAANGVVIEELKGLVWNKTYSTARSLAIAVNYPSTSLGDYAGGAYLWLGGGKKKVPCFTIPGVKAGSTITMEVESHKPAEGRGVELYTGIDADNLVDAATKIGDTFAPMAKESHSWTIESDCNVIVYNTNGCHIYKIEVVAGAAGVQAVKTVKVGNGFIYNLAGQRVDANYKGVVIKNGQKMIQK